MSKSGVYRIYHCDDVGSFVFMRAMGCELDFPEDYSHVATVEASSLREAITKIPSKALDGEPIRPLREGDILVDPQHQPWCVEKDGFSLHGRPGVRLTLEEIER